MASQPPPPCPFLTSLVPEVRMLIYEYVLGYQHIHLKRKRLPRHQDASLRLNRKSESFTPVYHRLCHAPRARLTLPTLECGSECLHTGQNTAKLSLSLLTTCHRVSAEALPILYSTNTFEIDGRALGAWVATLAPASRQRITALKVTAKLKDKVDGREWKAGCTAGAALLSGLKELNVSVRVRRELGMLSRIGGNQDWLRGILRFEVLSLQRVEVDFEWIRRWEQDEDAILQERLTRLEREVMDILRPRFLGPRTSEDLMDRMGVLAVAAGS